MTNLLTQSGRNFWEKSEYRSILIMSHIHIICLILLNFIQVTIHHVCYIYVHLIITFVEGLERQALQNALQKKTQLTGAY